MKRKEKRWTFAGVALKLCIMMRRFGFFLVLLLAIALLGCRQAELAPAVIGEQVAQSQPTMTATIRPSLTPSTTPTPSNTPTPSVTPSPTPTPTATAVAAEITRQPNNIGRQEPQPQGGAPCGIVDVFDFPIEPPNAETVSRGGGDFGRFRDRYDKFHAGEDWGAPAGHPNLGEPVYSIGHGRVMYAHPNGWGRDKGVIIVEHILPNWDIIYSFYGHLDPPSVEINAGECVRRGAKIANIGQPRTPPHLHFEIRNHTPYQPGSGYWPEDPTTVGWLPPSQTIWQQRMAAQPNVAWIRPFPEDAQFVGTLNDQHLVWMTHNSLQANNLSDGRAVSMYWPRVEHENEGRSDALVLPDASILYTVDDRGYLFQYANTAGAGTATPDYDLQWELDLESRGSPVLYALPGGGVLVTMRTMLWGISAAGEVMWQVDVAERPFSWAQSDNQIVFTTGGDDGAAWQVSGDQPPQKIADITGLPVLTQDSLWIYAQNELYHLDLAADADTAVSVVYTFPSTFFPRSGIAALPDGGVVLAHSDRFDQRLLAFNADGSLRWERSFADLRAGNSQLLQLDGRPFLVNWQLQGSSTTLVDVYELEMETAVLNHIFSGGTRTSAFNSWAIVPNDNQILLSINNSLVALAITPAETD